jgi:hypothetical protein
MSDPRTLRTFERVLDRASASTLPPELRGACRCLVRRLRRSGREHLHHEERALLRALEAAWARDSAGVARACLFARRLLVGA